jgi:hypothetical protein
MIDHDRLFKELLTVFFVEFLELFFPPVLTYLDTDGIEFLDKEVFTDVTSGEKHEADIVAKVRFRGRDAFFLVHGENQSYDQAEFARRMFHYFARFDEKHRLPIYPIAVFSYDKPYRAEPTAYNVEFPDFTPLNFQFRAIQLNRLDWREFVNKSNPVAAALRAKMKIAPKDRPKVKAQCLRLLVTLKLNPARMQLIWGFVESYLELNPQEEQVFTQEIAAIEPQEKKEATMEFINSFEERGMQEQALRMVQRRLERRFGPIEANIESRLSEMTIRQLEALDEATDEFKSVADITAYLKRTRRAKRGD